MSPDVTPPKTSDKPNKEPSEETASTASEPTKIAITDGDTDTTDTAPAETAETATPEPEAAEAEADEPVAEEAAEPEVMPEDSTDAPAGEDEAASEASETPEEPAEPGLTDEQAASEAEVTPSADEAPEEAAVPAPEEQPAADTEEPAEETAAEPVVGAEDVKPAESQSESSEEATTVAPTAEAAAEPAPAATEPAAAPTPGPTPAAGHKASGVWKGLLLLVALVVLAGGGWYAYTKYFHKQAAPVAATKKDIPMITYAVKAPGSSVGYPLIADTSVNTAIDSQLFEGLVAYQDRSKIVPLLATGWTNPDNTTWLFTLHPNVTFHSGRLMTPADVKSSLEYAMSHQKDNQGALAIASSIKSVDVVGSNQVKIITNGPDPTLLNRLTKLYIFDSKAKLGDPNAGTGPYVVKAGTSMTPTSVYLTAVPHYWGGHVYTRAVHIVTQTDPQQMESGLATGKYDLAGDFTAQALATLKPGNTITTTDVGTNFLGINTLKKDSPLASLKARQAAAYALNVPAILAASKVNGVQASQLVPPSIPGYDPGIQNTPFDQQKARELLAQVPNSSAKLTLSFPTSDELQATEIAKELNAAGFNVVPQKIDDFNQLIGVALGGKTDMFFLGYTSDTLDGLDTLSSILTGNADYDNPQIDKLVQQAGSTLDPATRIQQLQEIAQLAAKDEPVIPVYVKTTTFAVREHDYHVTADIPVQEVGVYFAKVYQE
ncbi:MAG TPA: ABC transporter substrate-binding protein [Candidatus Saccharimonadales bacterium]|nr:ABC transporter substrate-binding protein [Candidatus Saccharimonadales bacterium]